MDARRLLVPPPSAAPVRVDMGGSNTRLLSLSPASPPCAVPPASSSPASAASARERSLRPERLVSTRRPLSRRARPMPWPMSPGLITPMVSRRIGCLLESAVSHLMTQVCLPAVFAASPEREYPAYSPASFAAEFLQLRCNSRHCAATASVSCWKYRDPKSTQTSMTSALFRVDYL